MAEHDDIDQRLAIARAALTPPAAAKYRIRANIATPVVSPAPRASAGVVRAHGVSKLVTAGLVGLGFLAGYWLGWQRSTAPLEVPRPSAAVAEAVTSSPTVATAPAARIAASAPEAANATIAGSTPVPSATESSAKETTASETTAPETTALETTIQSAVNSGRSVTPRRRPPARAARAADDAYAAELALLTRAERAIRAQEAPLALTFLDELDRRFPDARFVEERSAARVLAECQLSAPMARARAESFLRSSASSVYTDRVRRSCRIDVAPQGTDGSISTGH